MIQQSKMLLVQVRDHQFYHYLPNYKHHLSEMASI